MTRTVEDVRKEHRALKQAYLHLFTGPDAQKVLDDLDKKFNRTTLQKVDKVIDPYASIAAAGCREVLLYIDYMMGEESAVK